MGAGVRAAPDVRGAASLITQVAFAFRRKILYGIAIYAVTFCLAGYSGADVLAQIVPVRPPGQLPDGPGKATYESVCSLCHPPGAPAGKQWLREQWELKVIEMLQEE